MGTFCYVSLKMLIFPVIFHAHDLQIVARQKNISSTKGFLSASTDSEKLPQY